ncbi:hypothetical protein M1O55_04120 [Dehalococcoidia bacterium]|nr:hypothetical protein [Dehalococcoidia bacterium]
MAVAEFFKLSTLDQPQVLEKLDLTDDDQRRFSRLVRLIDRLIEDSDYKKADEEIAEVLRIVPDHEPSYFNLALCRFNLLEGDLERAKAAQQLLNRSVDNTDTLSPELEIIRETIAYNTAVMGTKFGNSPRIFFDLSKSLIVEYEERDSLIRNFLQNQLTDLKKIVLNDIRLRKEEYIPNRTTCELLLLCSDYFEEATKMLCTYLSIPAAKFDSQSTRNKELLRDIYDRVSGRLPARISTYTFGGIFGGMKEKEVDTEKVLYPLTT